MLIAPIALFAILSIFGVTELDYIACFEQKAKK